MSRGCVGKIGGSGFKSWTPRRSEEGARGEQGGRAGGQNLRHRKTVRMKRENLVSDAIRKSWRTLKRTQIVPHSLSHSMKEAAECPSYPDARSSCGDVACCRLRASPTIQNFRWTPYVCLRWDPLDSITAPFCRLTPFSDTNYPLGDGLFSIPWTYFLAHRCHWCHNNWYVLRSLFTAAASVRLLSLPISSAHYPNDLFSLSSFSPSPSPDSTSTPARAAARA